MSIILHDYLRRTEASMPEGSGLLQEADSLGRSAHILYHLNLWHRTFAERNAVCSNVLGLESGSSMSYVRRSWDSFMKLYYPSSKLVKVICKLEAKQGLYDGGWPPCWERLMGYFAPWVVMFY